MWPIKRKRIIEDIYKEAIKVSDVKEVMQRIAEHEEKIRKAAMALPPNHNTSTSSHNHGVAGGSWGYGTGAQAQSPYTSASYDVKTSSSASGGSSWQLTNAPYYDEPDPSPTAEERIRELEIKLGAAWEAIEELQRELYGDE